MSESDYRKQLVDFYAKHNPSKIADVDAILESFRGNEKLMMHALYEKYEGRQPTPTSTPPPQPQQQAPPAALRTEGATKARQESQISDVSVRPRAHTAVNVSWHHGPVGSETSANAGDEPSSQPSVTIAPTQPAAEEAEHNSVRSGRSGSVSVTESATATAPMNVKSSTEMKRRHASVLDALTTQPAPEAGFASIMAANLEAQLGLLESQMKSIAAFDPVAIMKKGNDREIEAFIVAVTNFQNQSGSFVHSCAPIVEHLKSLATLGGTILSPHAADEATGSKHQQQPSQHINRFIAGTPQAHYRFEKSPSPHRNREASVVDQPVHDRRVIDVVPLDGETNVVSEIVATQCGAGDVILLHPGTYYENLLVGENVDVEIRPAIEGATGRVVIIPCDAAIPAVQVVANGVLRLDGITLVDSAEGNYSHPSTSNLNAQPALSDAAVPLMSFGGESRGEIRNVAVTGGNGGALVCHNASVSFTHCIFSRCLFAAIYVKDSAHCSLTHSSLLNCEVGMRVKNTTFAIANSQIRTCVSDGVALHGTVKGVIENANITRSGGSGVLLSPSSQVLITSSVIKSNEQYGIYAPSGADFGVPGTELADNGLGGMSRPAPMHSLIHSK